MEFRKTAGVILLAAGIFILLLSLFADFLSMGNYVYFGTAQIAGTIIRAIAAVGGLILRFKK